MLDAYDTRILAELQADARLTMAELGRRVHLSQPAVSERVKKLETAGVITGYRVSVNLQALGYGIRAVVHVGRTDYAQVVKIIQATPEVLDAFNVTGEDSWILHIAVVDVEHLDAVIGRFCTLADTSTAIVLKSIREHHPVVPPGHAALTRSVDGGREAGVSRGADPGPLRPTRQSAADKPHEGRLVSVAGGAKAKGRARRSKLP
jgi:Lrp/AsnC family transcriptional regulator, leucine-responsive regulatory protein